MELRKIAAAMMIAGGLLLGFGNGFSFDRLPIPIISKVELDGAYFLIIEESEERPAYLAGFHTDTGLKEEMSRLGAQYLVYDKDREEAEPYRARATKHGLPAYLLINGDGEIVSEGKLPESREAIVSIIKQE